jgi:hypothetical protein
MKGDRKGKRCHRCGEGRYEEDCLYDDWDRKVTCNKCGDHRDRYGATKEFN